MRQGRIVLADQRPVRGHSRAMQSLVVVRNCGHGYCCHRVPDRNSRIEAPKAIILQWLRSDSAQSFTKSYSATKVFGGADGISNVPPFSLCKA